MGPTGGSLLHAHRSASLNTSPTHTSSHTSPPTHPHTSPHMPTFSSHTSPHLQHLVDLLGQAIEVLLSQQLALYLDRTALRVRLDQGARLALAVHL